MDSLREWYPDLKEALETHALTEQSRKFKQQVDKGGSEKVIMQCTLHRLQSTRHASPGGKHVEMARGRVGVSLHSCITVAQCLSCCFSFLIGWFPWLLTFSCIRPLDNRDFVSERGSLCSLSPCFILHSLPLLTFVVRGCVVIMILTLSRLYIRVYLTD